MEDKDGTEVLTMERDSFCSNLLSNYCQKLPVLRIKNHAISTEKGILMTEDGAYTLAITIASD